MPKMGTEEGPVVARQGCALGAEYKEAPALRSPDAEGMGLLKFGTPSASLALP